MSPYEKLKPPSYNNLDDVFRIDDSDPNPEENECAPESPAENVENSTQIEISAAEAAQSEIEKPPKVCFCIDLKAACYFMIFLHITEVIGDLKFAIYSTSYDRPIMIMLMIVNFVLVAVGLQGLRVSKVKLLRIYLAYVQTVLIISISILVALVYFYFNEIKEMFGMTKTLIFSMCVEVLLLAMNFSVFESYKKFCESKIVPEVV